MICNRIFLTLGLLIFGYLTPVAPLLAKTFQQEREIVGRVEIVSGLSTLSLGGGIEQQIKMRLKTREGEIFSQTAFDNDLKILIQEYDRVEPILKHADGKIEVVLRVWPKPQVERIRWAGNEKIKTESLQSELNINAGATFDRQGFSKAFHALKTYYVKQGYFEAHLDYELNYSEDGKTVEIAIFIQEGRSGRIKRIVFSGFTRDEENAVTEMMVTKEYSFFLSWLTGEGIYNDEMVQHDTFVILNYIQNQGFADAQVSIDVEEAKQAHRVILKVSLQRGERYSLGNISIKGNRLLSEETLLDLLPFDQGDAYSPEVLHSGTQKITDRYGALGYIEAVVNYDAKAAADPHVYDIEISIDEGEIYHVGMIKILGNSTTHTKVILHETLLIPGELFNLKKLQITEARLLNIGFFKNVNVYAVKSDSCKLLPGNYRDVHIEVEEANTGHLGASFGANASQNVFGSIDLTERNFNAAALPTLFSKGFGGLRGGGEYFHLNFTFGSRVGNYGLSWVKPYFKDTNWSVGFDLDRSFNETISKDYDIHSTNLTLHATYAWNAYTRLRVHYRIKYADIKMPDEICQHCKEKYQSQGSPHMPGCSDHVVYPDDKNKCCETCLKIFCAECTKLRKKATNDGLISAAGFSWIYDSTNHPVKPTSGFKSKIECEFAGLGGDWHFLSFGYLNSYYYDFGFAIFKMRGDLRFLQPIGHTTPNRIALDERLFLGGEWEVRGYRPYRLGDKFCENPDDPTGGVSLQFFSLELSKELSSRADLFLFYDAGAISMDRWKVGPFFHSAGVGARVKLLEGMPPITVGYGFPFNRKDHSDVKQFFISVSGNF